VHLNRLILLNFLGIFLGEQIMKIQVLDFVPAGTFEHRWPGGNVERFDRTWFGHIAIDAATFEFRHALGLHHVYGRSRIHSVTFLKDQPIVEGVEADDYASSRALLSVIRRPNKKYVRTDADVPAEYKHFMIVDHSTEISAPRSPHSLAVKIGEDDVAAWAEHAAIRARQQEGSR
jgi:hypothetical protein